MDEYIQSWSRDKDGIYHTRWPKELTLSYITSDMTSVQRDYASTPFGIDIAVKTIIDASDVKLCSESVLLALNHAIAGFPKTKTAIYNESKELKEISDTFYSTNQMAFALKRFDKSEEALAWLNSN